MLEQEVNLYPSILNRLPVKPGIEFEASLCGYNLEVATGNGKVGRMLSFVLEYDAAYKIFQVWERIWRT